jgi:hypothetical protein
MDRNRGGRDGDRPPPELRPGDWQCPAGCGVVFASKSICFRCAAPKPEGAGQGGC